MIEYIPLCAFGFKISPNDYATKNFNDLELPCGYSLIHYGDFVVGNLYEMGAIIGISQTIINEVLTGERSARHDYSDLLEWAKVHDIHFVNDKPKLFVELYIG